MEPYKAKKLPVDYSFSKELLHLLCLAKESYGEYKGYLKSMSYDYKCFLECAFVNDLYYSFKIDGSKFDKIDMFNIPYKNVTNDVTIFNNMKSALLNGLTLVNSSGFTLDAFNKLNKIMLNNCSKNNKTKGSGHLRKIQTYILKPGLAGSSISFVPPVYSELNSLMNNLCTYINSDEDEMIIKTCITHYQIMRIHPYVSENGKLGRLILPIQLSYYKYHLYG